VIPSGTISDHDLRDGVSVVKVTHDIQATREYLADSVWRMEDSKVAVSQVSRVLGACIRDHPKLYARIAVTGHPGAVGYTAQENSLFIRRVLVPLPGRVVILSTSRQGDDAFSVTPEQLLAKALKASADAPP
jgi:energy-coupling factor transporter ATP-binding protein EcfA2